MPAAVGIAVIVSANIEWEVVRSAYPINSAVTFRRILLPAHLSAPVLFFQGGWGKVAAASIHAVPHLILSDRASF
jgi:hypothetical protein